MKILAVSVAGREYLYTASSAHAIKENDLDTIRSVLNRSRFRLKDGETWHVHDVGPYDRAHAYASAQRFFIRSGRVYEGGRA